MTNIKKMHITENALNILTLISYKGVGNAWIRAHLNPQTSAEEIVHRLNESTQYRLSISQKDFLSKRDQIQDLLWQGKNFIDGAVAFGDENFPEYRGTVTHSERPICLFYKGDLNLLQERNSNIAVIGLRHPDSETEIFERKVVQQLIQENRTIVSGLALGCDSIAHQQAISSKGKTIAILPSALSEVIPFSNRPLADAIIQNGGLLVSEYYTKADSIFERSDRYQNRDRLQALFSDGVILAASYTRRDQGRDSGSRFAMGYAAKYRIPRAVLYNATQNHNNPQYGLNRKLMEEDKSITIISEENYQQVLKQFINQKRFVQSSLIFE